MKILRKIEALRSPAYEQAHDLLFETGADVVRLASAQTANEVNLAVAEERRRVRKERFCKTLSPRDQAVILQNQTVYGKTLEETFWRWRQSDLENLSTLCRRMTVENLTVDDMAAETRKTIETYSRRDLSHEEDRLRPHGANADQRRLQQRPNRDDARKF